MDGGRVTAAITDNGQVIEADEFVVAVGPKILRFMQKVTGVYVPVYPMVGYSLTIPIRDKPSSTCSTLAHRCMGHDKPLTTCAWFVR